jgi:uncharacterized protein YpmB
MIVNIIIGIIILHLVAGFGFILWKLMGPVKEDSNKVEIADKEKKAESA